MAAWLTNNEPKKSLPGPVPVGRKLPRVLILRDHAFIQRLHSSAGGNLTKAAAQVPAQNLSSIKVSLPCVGWLIEIFEPWVWRRIVALPQQLF